MDKPHAMKRVPAIAALLLIACSTADERAVQRALHGGAAQYRAGNFAEAAAIFADAPQDARLDYNLGNAQYRQHLFNDAVVAFQGAESRADSNLVTKASYNLGTARLLQARQADSLGKAYTKRVADIRIEGDDIKEKVALYVLRDSLRRDIRRLDLLVDSALKAGAAALRSTLLVDPSDEDARHNLVAAKRLIASRAKEAAKRGDKSGDDDDKKVLGERAMMLIKQADELVDAYKFAEALALLNAGLKQDPTLEQRKDYMEKLELVEKAAAVQ